MLGGRISGVFDNEIERLNSELQAEAERGIEHPQLRKWHAAIMAGQERWLDQMSAEERSAIARKRAAKRTARQVVSTQEDLTAD
jgi:hypothetical protein